MKRQQQSISKILEKALCECDAKVDRGDHATEQNVITLAELPVGSSATIVKVMPQAAGLKKFADIGMVAGAELQMEAHAPFGGLLRVKIMGTSMAIHRDDAVGFILKLKGA